MPTSEPLLNYEDCEATESCAHPPPPPGSKPIPPQPYLGPFQPIHPIIPPTVVPHDPNNIIGPSGFGAENFVSVNQVLPYQINFENEAAATAPAQQVVVTQQLDSNLNWKSFRLGSFGFGGTTFTVPANTAFYQTQIDLTETNGYFGDVTATIDERTGIATWTFTTIDPATGQIPLNPSVGFLPPDSPAGVGEGFVSYTVMANRSAATGTVINAQATVDFYTQPPIDTPLIFNTIDTGTDLSSAVASLPAVQSSPTITVSWAGSDDTAGSAVNNYTVYVSDNGGPFVPWLQDTSLTSAPYVGEDGHTYAFYSVASDNTGNDQSEPGPVQTTTIQPLGVSAVVTNVSSLTANGTYGVGANVFITVMFSNPVTVTGTPQLALNSGGTANYTGGNGTSTLTFIYVVGAGQDSAPRLRVGLRTIAERRCDC